MGKFVETVIALTLAFLVIYSVVSLIKSYSTKGPDNIPPSPQTPKEEEKTQNKTIKKKEQL